MHDILRLGFTLTLPSENFKTLHALPAGRGDVLTRWAKVLCRAITDRPHSNNTGNLSIRAGVNYTYGDTNHDHAVTQMGSDSYSYDNNGNQVTRNVSGSLYALSYDAENRLVGRRRARQVSVSGAATATFVYDGDGNRVKATVGTTTTYVGGYFEWTGSTSTMKKYYYAGATRVAMRTGSSTINYLLGDHLGSQAITTDANGSKISEVRYYPWGRDRYYAYTSTTTYRFTGQRTEFGLGLYYYGARFYDPSAGRFISADTIIPGAGNPQAYDRYAYVLNNPLKYIDPSGHLSCDAQHVADGDCSDATLEERIIYFGINLEATWKDEDLLQILSAVSIIGLKFSLALGNMGAQMIDAFKSVFNGVTFSLDPTLAEKGYYGQASVDQDSFLPGKITNRLIAHELGHTFSYRMARSSGNVYTANHPETLLNTYPGLVNDEGVFMTGEHGGYSRNDGKTGLYGGYLCDTVPCQYHYHKGNGVIMAGALTAGEDWADMFLNWSMGGFSPKPRGNFYNNWMTTNMGEWVSMAAGE